MKGFQDPEARVPNLLILAAILLLIGSLAFMLFVKPPSVAGLATKRQRSMQKLQDEVETLKKRSAEATAATKPRMSAGDPEALTAQTLARLTQLARVRGVNLGGFRPQRTKVLPGVTEMPYAVQLRGPFPAVRGFASDLDAPGGKIVLRSLQLAASDGDTSNVTATLGVSIFIESVNSDDSESSNNRNKK
ncbi:MAG: hypothetical protein QM758_12030 [Armatimonas sp.]